jgi:hypothetical protein
MISVNELKDRIRRHTKSDVLDPMVVLTEEEVEDIKEYQETRIELGYPPEFEMIGPYTGDDGVEFYNIGRCRRPTKEERDAIMARIREKHTFKRKGDL